MRESETYMMRCLELAGKGLGRVSPNPLVGSIIVHNDRIIGEGYHFRFGGPHAEVIAIASVKDKEALKTSTLYVNLEPCSHYGKTPPCADLIISYGIPKVVIGTADPFPEVAGKGIGRLREAGVEVISGILEDECRMVNRRFFTFHLQNRPYIILKWATSSDGFIAPDEASRGSREDWWISGKASGVLVHRWRSEEDSIFVGTRTVRSDDPELTVREWYGRNPLRVILDMRLEFGPFYKALNEKAVTLILNGSREDDEGHLHYRIVASGDQMVPDILRILWEMSVQSVIIEGGADIHRQFISHGLWDEARVLGGQRAFTRGLPAPQLPVPPAMHRASGHDQVHYFFNEANPVLQAAISQRNVIG